MRLRYSDTDLIAVDVPFEDAVDVIKQNPQFFNTSNFEENNNCCEKQKYQKFLQLKTQNLFLNL
jgi:phage regulator Rha-like protein